MSKFYRTAIIIFGGSSVNLVALRARLHRVFVEETTWRKENASWLRWSRQTGCNTYGRHEDHGMKRADLAARLEVSPQYVSKLLSGTENLSFKSIANIETTWNNMHGDGQRLIFDSHETADISLHEILSDITAEERAEERLSFQVPIGYDSRKCP